MTLLTVEQRLQKAHSTLVMSPRFALLSGILMFGESKVVDKAGPYNTAYTNGRDKFYGREFVKSLNDKELAFVVAHENFHVLLKQLTVFQKLYKQDPMRANMACDYVINQMISDLDPDEIDIKVPEMALINPEFKGMSTLEVFNQLPPSGGSNGGSGGGGNQHPLDAHGWEEAESMSDEEKAEIQKMVDMATRQGGLLAGKMKGKGPRELGLIPEPAVDWKEQLREFVSSIARGKDYSTWRKPRRRWLAQGVYMPTSYSDRVGRALFAADTSGSISHELGVFMAEMGAILEDMPPEALDVVYWGSDVVKHETYEPKDYSRMVNNTEPHDGGGTDPHCIKEWLMKRPVVEQPEFIIVFTDGYIYDGWPTFSVPTLWVVVDNPQAVASSGTTLHIDSGRM